MTGEPAALLGLDLGTSGVKAIVIGLDGTVLAEAARDYPVSSPGPGRAESDPYDWWAAAREAAGAALAEPAAAGARPAGIGVDGQMHGLVLAEGDGTPVRPALLWADSRAAGEVAAWAELSEPLRRDLANPLTPGMTGPLLRWVRRNEPAAYERGRVALLPKDWLRHRLTGRFATDPSDASATLLWDAAADSWATDAIGYVGLDPALLPPVLPSGALAGELTGEVAGLPPGVPVAAGAGDTPAALLATGLTGPADLQISVGSGAQILRPADAPVVVPYPRTHLYRRAEPAGWYAMAAVQNAGLALGWVRRVLGLTWEELYEAAGAGEPGAGGVTFLPYLTGERSPVLDAAARGTWLGLSLATDRAALAQSAVEGVAFAIRHALEALPPAAPPTEARLIGGGIAAPRFRAMLADVLEIPLRPVGLRSASAVGAALLAADAAGLPRPPVPVRTGELVLPGERAASYAAPYTRYLDQAARHTSPDLSPATR